MRFGKAAATETGDQGTPMSLLEAFQQDLTAGLGRIAESCASEMTAVDEAEAALCKLQGSVDALLDKKADRQLIGEKLQAEASQAAADGKDDVAGLIRERASAKAEVETIRDILKDLTDVRLPAARKSLDEAKAVAAGKLKRGIIDLRNELQRKHIDRAIFQMADMQKLHKEFLKEFRARYPENMVQDLYTVEPPKASLILPSTGL